MVRQKFYKVNRTSINDEKFNILVVGGSQGARVFDNELKQKFVNISKKFLIQVYHQTSEKNIPILKDYYQKNDIDCSIFSFESNFEKILIKSDLCITRAGASTLAELSVLNIPFITIPLPTSKDNHQLENANFYKDKDCCWMIKQQLLEEKIEELINNIIQNKTDFFTKKENLKRLNYQNTWINVNQKILNVINEN